MCTVPLDMIRNFCCIYVCIFVYVCIYVCMYVCINVCMYLCILYIYMNNNNTIASEVEDLLNVSPALFIHMQIIYSMLHLGVPLAQCVDA